jgi:hypothetical protein
VWTDGVVTRQQPTEVEDKAVGVVAGWSKGR